MAFLSAPLDHGSRKQNWRTLNGEEADGVPEKKTR
jgi:hypothetical protein